MRKIPAFSCRPATCIPKGDLFDIGPLAGLDAAMAGAGDGGWLLIASCDLLVVRSHWLARLIAAAP